MVHALIIVAAIVIGAGWRYFTNTNDSAVEQIAEEVLKQEGINIDFSDADKQKDNCKKGD
ncbi:MAG: hypothetical protein KIH63_004800 [Candidatus Saccharibacteria bacterium]|nr:hypothetical protein [Candidatus Saccharibacteria bacterium]